MQIDVKIYVLRDPRTLKIRYVGKTVKKLESRLALHIWRSNRTTRSKCCAWIRQLTKLGLRPIIEQIDLSGVENWVEKEKFWIAHYRALTTDLLNSTDGGEGVHGYKHSPERLQKMREFMLENSHKMQPVWTKEMREERARKVSEQSTPERRAAHKEKMRQYWTPERRAAAGKQSAEKWTPEMRAAQAQRTMDQFDKQRAAAK